MAKSIYFTAAHAGERLSHFVMWLSHFTLRLPTLGRGCPRWAEAIHAGLRLPTLGRGYPRWFAAAHAGQRLTHLAFRKIMAFLASKRGSARPADTKNGVKLIF